MFTDDVDEVDEEIEEELGDEDGAKANAPEGLSFPASAPNCAVVAPQVATTSAPPLAATSDATTRRRPLPFEEVEQRFMKPQPEAAVVVASSPIVSAEEKASTSHHALPQDSQNLTPSPPPVELTAGPKGGRRRLMRPQEDPDIPLFGARRQAPTDAVAEAASLPAPTSDSQPAAPSPATAIDHVPTLLSEQEEPKGRRRLMRPQEEPEIPLFGARRQAPVVAAAEAAPLLAPVSDTPPAASPAPGNEHVPTVVSGQEEPKGRRRLMRPQEEPEIPLFGARRQAPVEAAAEVAPLRAPTSDTSPSASPAPGFANAPLLVNSEQEEPKDEKWHMGDKQETQHLGLSETLSRESPRLVRKEDLDQVESDNDEKYVTGADEERWRVGDKYGSSQTGKATEGSGKRIRPGTGFVREEDLDQIESDDDDANKVPVELAESEEKPPDDQWGVGEDKVLTFKETSSGQKDAENRILNDGEEDERWRVGDTKDVKQKQKSDVAYRKGTGFVRTEDLNQLESDDDESEMPNGDNDGWRVGDQKDVQQKEKSNGAYRKGTGFVRKEDLDQIDSSDDDNEVPNEDDERWRVGEKMEDGRTKENKLADKGGVYRKGTGFVRQEDLDQFDSDIENEEQWQIGDKTAVEQDDDKIRKTANTIRKGTGFVRSEDLDQLDSDGDENEVLTGDEEQGRTIDKEKVKEMVNQEKQFSVSSEDVQADVARKDTSGRVDRDQQKNHKTNTIVPNRTDTGAAKKASKKHTCEDVDAEIKLSRRESYDMEFDSEEESQDETLQKKQDKKARLNEQGMRYDAAATAMSCSRCGATFPSAAAFCVQCGARRLETIPPKAAGESSDELLPSPALERAVQMPCLRKAAKDRLLPPVQKHRRIQHVQAASPQRNISLRAAPGVADGRLERLGAQYRELKAMQEELRTLEEERGWARMLGSKQDNAFSPRDLHSNFVESTAAKALRAPTTATVARFRTRGEGTNHTQLPVINTGNFRPCWMIQMHRY